MASAYLELEHACNVVELEALLDECGFKTQASAYSLRVSDLPDLELLVDASSRTVRLATIHAPSNECRDQVERLSACLSSSMTVHRVEMYDGDSLIGYLHYSWPPA